MKEFDFRRHTFANWSDIHVKALRLVQVKITEFYSLKTQAQVNPPKNLSEKRIFSKQRKD